MSTINLIVFLLQFFVFIPALFWFFRKAEKDGWKKKKLLAAIIAVVCYASLNTFFHRHLILSDIYYVLGDWKKSGDAAERGFKLTENKSGIYDVIYGRYSLYRKMRRAEEKEKSDKQ